MTGDGESGERAPAEETATSQRAPHPEERSDEGSSVLGLTSKLGD